MVLIATFVGSGQAAQVAGQGTSAAKPAVSSPAKPAGKPAATPAPVRRGLSDAQIERNIRARLARSKMNGKEHFAVSVQDGVATWEGKTDVIQHKGTATRLAKLSGAVAVENHIQISDAAKAKATARLAKYRGTAGATTAMTASASGPVRATVLPASK